MTVIRRIITIIILALATVSCVQRSKYQGVSTQRDSLLVANGAQTRQMDTLQSYIKAISNCIDSIAVQESILFLPDPESNRPLTTKEKLQRIESFQNLIDRQRETICRLEEKISADSLEMSNLHSIITFLSNQIKDKDEAISRLKAELTSVKSQVRKLNNRIDNLNTQITSLNDNIANLESTNQDQMQALTAQDMLLNEAYVCIGSKKELQAQGIKFGIKINYSSVDRTSLTKVDIREYRSVMLNSEKIKILTPMPAGSYSINSGFGQTIIEILDPGLFWSNSNILIIQTDPLIVSKQK